MSLSILRDDALSTDGEGSVLRASLPWIRSLPLACLRDVRVAIDDAPIDGIRLRHAGADVDPRDLGDIDDWWYVQDRLVLAGIPALAAGEHRVTVSFSLLIPYLPGGPDAPLILPFRQDRACTLDAVATRADVSRDAA